MASFSWLAGLNEVTAGQWTGITGVGQPGSPDRTLVKHTHARAGEVLSTWWMQELLSTAIDPGRVEWLSGGDCGFRSARLLSGLWCDRSTDHARATLRQSSRRPTGTQQRPKPSFQQASTPLTSSARAPNLLPLDCAHAPSAYTHSLTRSSSSSSSAAPPPRARVGCQPSPARARTARTDRCRLRSCPSRTSSRLDRCVDARSTA